MKSLKKLNHIEIDVEAVVELSLLCGNLHLKLKVKDCCGCK